MPILNGFEATECIRTLEKSSPFPKRRVSHILNGRIPVFAVSASLLERQRDELANIGVDGWILKPIDFKRLRAILRGVTDSRQRERDEYTVGHWEIGGWFPRSGGAGSDADKGAAVSRKLEAESGAVDACAVIAAPVH